MRHLVIWINEPPFVDPTVRELRMSDAERKRVPETQSSGAGKPPGPPKKTTKGLDDEPPDPRKLTEAERVELVEHLIASLRKSG
jgi:hypothetical protein